jgi:hypothetical protein
MPQKPRRVVVLIHDLRVKVIPQVAFLTYFECSGVLETQVESEFQ